MPFFFTNENGDYYETLTDIPTPAGHTAVSQRAALAPTPADVFAERERRILAGTTINVTGYGDVQLSGSDRTRSDLQALVTVAQMRVQAGSTAAMNLRGLDGTIHALTPLQVIDLWGKGVAFIQAVTAASWIIEAMDPIPANYATRSEWP